MSVRVRHYTRINTLHQILSDQRLIAGDQNKVFVEKANRQPLGPRDAEQKHYLKRGKGNAFLEFDAEDDEIHEQTNALTGIKEQFLRGDIDLTDRNPLGRTNI